MPQQWRAGLGTNCHKGGTLIMTLVFVSMFTVIFASLTSLVSRTFKQTVLQAQDELAFQMAESGLSYGGWRLAHDPDNYPSETREISDPFAGPLGTFEITMEAPLAGQSIINITSTGATANHPERTVVLKARYGQPSLAQYATIVNEDVWYDGAIAGAVHANGGIRMDGTSISLMTSAKETYLCQSYHGCSPSETKPGIWGSGDIQELWEFEIPPINFAGISSNLLLMEEIAENTDDHYGPADSGLGYQIEFKNDNTYLISQVTELTNPVRSATYEQSQWRWRSLSHDVMTQTSGEIKDVPADGVIFVHDQLWIKGDIRDRITVVAAHFPDSSANNVDIIINGNISYGGVTDGSRSFAAFAQRDIIIPWSGAPDVMQLDGAFIAQKGKFHRRFYPDCCGAEDHRLKTSLTLYGMMASNKVPVTAWVSGASGGSGLIGDYQASIISGYQSGSTSYDPNFRYLPPPYFPSSGPYQFISWDEQQ